MMFASDAPWVPVKRHVDMVDALDISPEDAEKIWSGTAKEFFGVVGRPPHESLLSSMRFTSYSSTTSPF